jgi:uncharacterized protein YraI
MRAKIITAVAAAAALFAGAAQAATGFTVERTALYAGPGDDYPRVQRVPSEARVTVHGCIRAYDWCDVSFRGERGWMDGGDIIVRERGRRIYMRDYGPRYNVPLISFSFGSYWDSNYRNHRFYRDRDRWTQRASRDMDHDGIPNRFDRDRDGDGRANNVDRNPNVPNRANDGRNPRDEDHDGIPNRFDRDRDGDGTPNRRDDRPDNPRRDEQLQPSRPRLFGRRQGGKVRYPRTGPALGILKPQADDPDAD